MAIIEEDDLVLIHLQLIGKERMQQEIWFQKYRIIRQIGRGGTAEVYLAEHIKLNTLRAIKFISKSNSKYEAQLKEAQILKNLKHSCIPIIYDIEEDEYGSYIVEQYLEGDTLKNYVQAKGHIGEDQIIRFAQELCDLVQYLHTVDRPILYLDLKPENIIITENTVKLIDFGSAVFRDEIKEKQDFFGTRGYAAPELYRHGKVDERCDVYGIGMLLYYMVTGNPAYDNTDGIDNVDFIDSCPGYLKKIINRCLRYNPSQRYASVTQLSKHLSAIKRKKTDICESGQSLSFAVAGAQPRIGVTHFSFRLCSYFTGQHIKCLYRENNNSHCIWLMKSRYTGMNTGKGLYEIQGIPMLDTANSDPVDPGVYQITVDDLGCLTGDNLEEFRKADVKILILGAKDWELTFAEQVLTMAAEYKDVVYLFNFLDGRQFHQVMKSMNHKYCYRIPYEPDPFAPVKGSNSLELFKELIRISRAGYKTAESGNKPAGSAE